jgi:CHAT domain-containing protein
MKRLLRFLIVALVGLFLSLQFHWSLPVGAESTIQSQNSALSLVQEGKQYYDTGQFSEAARVLKQAAQAYEVRGDTLKQAQVLSLLSLAQQKLGRWQEAEAAINQSLSLLEKVTQQGEQLPIRAQVLNAKGQLQLTQGQAEAAVETWQEAENLYDRVGDRVGVTGSQINQAAALETLGFYRRSCNTVLKAFQIKDLKCEELDTESLEQVLIAFPKQSNSLQIIGLRSLGNMLRLLGKLNESQMVLEKSLTIAQQLRSPPDESKAWLGLGNTQQAFANRARDLRKTETAQKSAQEAIDSYRQAATRSESLTALQAQLNELSLLIETEQRSPAQKLMPTIEEKIGKLPASRTSVYMQVNFAQSMALLKQKQANAKVSWPEITALLDNAVQSAAKIGDKRAESYALGSLGQLQYEQSLSSTDDSQALLARSLALAQSENAPEIAYRWQWQLGRIYRERQEKERAIATYQTAVDTLQVLRGDLIALNQEIQFSFREQVEPVYREFADLLLASSRSNQENLKKARLAIEALQLAELDNYFQDACAIPKKTIEGVDPHAAVIYTVIFPNRFEVILSLPDETLKLHTNVISQTELENTLERLQQTLREPDRLNEVQALSQQVYRWLIASFEQDLDSQIKTLVFVLDGALQNLPVAALYNGKQYLAERYATAVTPGLRLLGPQRLSQQVEALVAGVSQERRIGEQGFAALNYVENEWQAIESIVSSQALLNANFTQSNLQKRLDARSFSVVHIATHGQFSSDPDQTFILLWDRVLNVRDLDNLLQPSNRPDAAIVDLLVLSACQTASGDRRATLGLAGVAVRTGARSTLATLWQVNDESTAALMSRFYQKLIENRVIAKAEALRQAQLDLWKNTSKDWQVPFFWAAYVLVGNWL